MIGRSQLCKNLQEEHEGTASAKAPKWEQVWYRSLGEKQEDCVMPLLLEEKWRLWEIKPFAL